MGGLQKVMPIVPIYKIMCLAIVLLDTFILFLRAFITRVSLLGISNIFHQARVPDNISILYLDVGTHKEGSELLLVVDEILPPICNNFEAYGFEANQESFEQIAKKFADRENVQLIHKALVHNLPSNGKIKLYKDMGSGLADSIYRHTTQYEEVECMRLSDFLIESRLIKDNRIVLLRMNIEGAEYDVIQDLVENKLNNCIDGYFGMWDDVSKIDIGRDAEFRTFLAKHQINSFTFNGRDLYWSFRRKCIVYHMHTRIMQGLRKLQQGLDSNPKRQVLTNRST
ncbi:MAG: FkbM family methyltransferase [Calothrix sp. MO_167.B12]|nr:FkbM family methyltransferase [Calothrix sp. MO_167.B12]